MYEEIYCIIKYNRYEKNFFNISNIFNYNFIEY